MPALSYCDGHRFGCMLVNVSSSPRPVRIVLLARVAAIGYALFAVCFLGLSTNWFRYNMSLEQAVAAVPAVLGILLVVPLGIFVWIRRSEGVAIAVIVIVASASILSLIVLLAAPREAVPSFARDHIERSGTAELQAHGRTIKYELELHNPFATSHHEYVVITVDAIEHRIPLQLFSGRVGGYASPRTPKDWVVLHPSQSPAVYFVEIGYFLGPTNGFFSVDLRTNTATKVQQVPAG
jgi:hypothetical protein